MKMLALTLAVLLLMTRADAQELEFINPDGLVKNPNLTQVIKAGKLLFLSGQTGRTADGQLAGPGMKEQLEQVLNNLEAALQSQGVGLSHIAKTITFVTDMEEFRSPEVLDLRIRRFGNRMPTGTLVQVVRLARPGVKIEIDAIAVLP